MTRVAQFNHSETPPPSIWGEPGDQLKIPGEYEEAEIFERGELNIVPWYSGSWKWLLRPIENDTAYVIAHQAEMAARNPAVGYSQTNDRLSFHRELEKAGSAEDIKTPCNGDCSSGWAAISNYAGVAVDPNLWTGSMLYEASASGKYLISYDPVFLASPDYLLPGDALLRPATEEIGGHTMTVIDRGKLMSTLDFAEAAISPGRWNLRYCPSINSGVILELTGGMAVEIYLPCIQQGDYYWYFCQVPGGPRGFISRPAFKRDEVIRINRDTWLRTGPGLDFGQILVVPEGAYVLSVEYRAVDNRGVTWYRVGYGNRWGYVSGKNAEVVR